MENENVKSSKFKNILKIVLKVICFTSFIFLLLLVILSLFSKHSKDVSALSSNDYDFVGLYTSSNQSSTYQYFPSVYNKRAFTGTFEIGGVTYSGVPLYVQSTFSDNGRVRFGFYSDLSVVIFSFTFSTIDYYESSFKIISILSEGDNATKDCLRSILLRYYNWSSLNVNYSITTYLQNLTTDLPSTVSSDTEFLNGQFTPINSTYYTYPADYDLSVSGCDYNYNSSTGAITLFDFSGNITITAKAYPLWVDDPDKNINVDTIPKLSDLDYYVNWNTNHFTYQLTYLHATDNGDFKPMYSLLSYGSYNQENHYYPFMIIYSKSLSSNSDIRETGKQTIRFQVEFYPDITYYVNNLHASEYIYALDVVVDYTDSSNHLPDTSPYYTTFNIILSKDSDLINNELVPTYKFEFFIDKTPFKENATWVRIPNGINTNSVYDNGTLFDDIITEKIYISNLNLWVNDDSMAPRDNRLQYVDMFRSLNPNYIGSAGAIDTSILLRGTNVFRTLTTERTLFGDVVSSFLNIQFGEFTIGSTTFRLTLGVLLLFIIGLGAIFVILKVFLGG